MKLETTISTDFVDTLAVAVVERLRPMLKSPTSPPTAGEDLMSIEALAAYLGGVSVDWIYQRTAKNEIPFLKVGRLLRFRRADIDRWLASLMTPAISPLSGALPPRLVQRPRDSESRSRGVTTRERAGKIGV